MGYIKYVLSVQMVCIYLYVSSDLLYRAFSVWGLDDRINDWADPLLWCVVMDMYMLYVNCISGV